jgi:hypothetical protein
MKTTNEQTKVNNMNHHDIINIIQNSDWTIDILEMTDSQLDILLATKKLNEAQKEINRLRSLIVDLAENKLSETEKQILLA